MKLELRDFEAIKDSAIKTFEERVTAAGPKTGRAFDLEVARLESQLVQLYGLAAIMARREPEMEKTAALWDTLVMICDAFAQRVRERCLEEAACQASYDKILDIRNACVELRDLHR